MIKGLALEVYKNNLKFTPAQTAILIGSLLGDGTLRLGKRAVNVNLKIEHGLAQKEYVWWKYLQLKEWVLTPPKLSYRYKDNDERYEKSWWFRTVRHPKITFFHKMFYIGGRKEVPKTIESYLNPLSLAVWIMDDGSFNKKHLDISTYAFGEDEIKILQQALWGRFSIIGKYFRDRNKGLRMYFSTRESEKNRIYY